MSALNIEGVFTAYKYCHKFHNDCPKKYECIRYDKNMLHKWLSCVMNNPDCNEQNGYPYLLLEPPFKDELPSDYFGSSFCGETEENTSEKSLSSDDEKVIKYLNDVISHSRSTFYIEPFVGGSNVIQGIKGIDNIFGTDIDKDRLESIMTNMKGTSKNYQVYDYKTWSKVLLSDNYKGKCIVYCEPPSKDSDKFTMEEFLQVVKEWALRNKVFVRCSNIKRRKPVLELEKKGLYFL